MSFRWSLPYSELELSFVRSRGPGGQNVNKTNSACQLRWNLQSTASLPDEVKVRLLLKLASRLTEDGDLLLRSDQFRDQEANKKACIERLVEIIQQALHEPKPRRKTKPTKSSVRKRLNSKGLRSEIKKLRQSPKD